MRVLVPGAGGLIGSAVAARLRAAGHHVVAVSRASASRLPQADAVIRLDLRDATTPAAWRAHLAGIDSVVNCAGVLQDGPGDATRAVHVESAVALFQACAAAGIRRVIQVSAIGVDRDPAGAGAATAFAASKRAGDAALMALDLDWVVLRPSVVVGRAAYGGSALFRALATLPVLPVVPGAGRLQIVQLDEVAATVEILLRPGAPARLALDLAGPEALAFEEVIAHYRAWRGAPPARLLPLPAWLARAAFALGDLAGRLGWRAPLRSTALRELAQGATGDPGPWMRATGIRPRALGEALAAEPASVQERWFARLYLLKPALIAGLALYWAATGLVALGPGFAPGVALMEAAGLGTLAVPAVVAGALADIAVGAAIAVRRTAGTALRLSLALSAAYLAAATLLLPGLWADPLGPLVKIAPVLLLTLVALAVKDDR